MRQHYQDRRDYYLAKARRANEKERETLRKLLAELKAVPCSDCGGSFPACAMDFDHVMGEKSFNVGQGLTRGRKRMLLEAANCEIVCANCHRQRTYNRLIGGTRP